ncbi:hypothetical protein [Maribacter sp.]|uniref:hypothetical protein n=1 Tax=Maribacter sp. TaxID=1897614 RepID=UPI0025BFBA32|nr:hypothetical protein [Maribacter sp.]
MADKIQYKNRNLLVILDEDPVYNIYVPDYQPTPYLSYEYDKYYLQIYIELFPNGYGFGWDSNIYSCYKTVSNQKDIKDPEKALKQAINVILKYYQRNHFFTGKFNSFLRQELEPKNLFSFDYQ